jgi:hypothetical protein
MNGVAACWWQSRGPFMNEAADDVIVPRVVAFLP